MLHAVDDHDVTRVDELVRFDAELVEVLRNARPRLGDLLASVQGPAERELVRGDPFGVLVHARDGTGDVALTERPVGLPGGGDVLLGHPNHPFLGLPCFDPTPVGRAAGFF